MKKEMVIALVLALVFSVTVAIAPYATIELTYPGMDYCNQQIGVATDSGNYSYPVQNATLCINESCCITDVRGFCTLKLVRDKVYEIKIRNETARLFVACQEPVVIVRA